MKAHTGDASPIFHSGLGVFIVAVVGPEAAQDARVQSGQQLLALGWVDAVESARALEPDPVGLLLSSARDCIENFVQGFQGVGHFARGVDVHAFLSAAGRSGG